jgi:cytochrome c
MKQFLSSLVFCTVFLVPTQAHANQALTTAKNCMSCHAVDKKLVGLAFKDIATRYATDKTATDKLVTKVMQGGVGVWGSVPISTNPQVTEAEEKQLVTPGCWCRNRAGGAN